MKYAVVTGSSKGIGKQIGIDLLKENYFVFFNYGHDDSVLSSLEEELSLISLNFKILKNDFSNINSINNFVDEISTATSKIDALILNAAITNRAPFEELSFDEWNNVLMTNLSAPFFLVQKFKKMLNKNANIIFIGALMGILPHAVSIPYGVSKAGIHMLCKYLVKEFCDDNIRVNTIAPGFVETPWQKNKPVDQRKRIEDKIALHRFAKCEEISDAVIFVIKNNYINGAVINIDGSYSYR